MAQLFQDLIYSFGNCLNCFPGSPSLKINSRSFKILRLLGEGGFSYVYLVQDTSSGDMFALKKIRCPFGAESVQQAMREVEAYKTFAHSPGIIHSVDYSIASERNDPGSKTVYVLLPYYKRGNLQDIINANLVNHTKFPEKKLMVLFLGVCKAMKDMHHYQAPAGGERMEMGNAKAGEEDQVAAPGERRSYAHRDIKPGNIMIDDDGSNPIIMDLGSVAISPIPITSRSQAIAMQDTAAEHSTMPYRAPELFEVNTGAIIDTKVDIWSLGCTLYACLVGKSPFEMRSDETGGSLSMCVLGGDWRFPDEGPKAISEPIKEVVRKCLTVEPDHRPDIDELIAMVEEVVEELPDSAA
ncbi:kinase-like domain-containing protein [Truncatella angustata]|uniref:non-specific serine/threonine protein kinase n=1 Tax=Truncatella angustata TaxID=152316 RepID=A0A9P8UBR3_9PEZI|nr:kinase-like domain-containing protein [Truncatella angustata]KAH6646427.1 kinase-like domain-containing protein [Truncatella angustata]